MLGVGIVGLPNSGKSTLFNALLRKHIAQVGEYPYTTIEPNVGVVEVSDKRLEKISKVTKIEKIVPAAIKFIDIAGLIRGAHKGEGLGNQFLAKIREVDVIVHVVRAFENTNVEHTQGKIDPMVDIDVISDELKEASIEKSTICLINISEKDFKDSSLVQTIELIRKEVGVQVLPVCAKLESEISEFSDEEQKQYFKELGIKESGLDQVVKAAYKLLDLITFFTIVGAKQLQAWPIKRGKTAVEAAEVVHSDFAKGFIIAEVVDYPKLVDSGSWHAAKEKGLVKTVGKDGIIEDGQVVEFKFTQ